MEGEEEGEIFDVGLLDQLESLGFPRLVCQKALWSTGGAAHVIGQQSDPHARAAIVERAMMWCFEHGEDEDIAEPMDFAAQHRHAQQRERDDPYDGYFDASLVQVLQEMGFSAARAHRGLFFTGNSSVEAAMEWIIGHSLDDDIDQPLDPEEVNSGPPDPCQELIRAMRSPLDLMLEQRLMGLCESILRLQERHVFSREGDMKVAASLLRVLQMPLETVSNCPDAPVCACRAVKAFSEMSDDLRQFFSRHEALAVILSCVDRGDPILTEEAISCIDLITGSRGLPRQLVEHGAMDQVLSTLEPVADKPLPHFASKVLRLVRKICRQVRGANVSRDSLDKLCTLVIAEDQTAALGAAQCFERLLAQHRVAGEVCGGFPVKLVEMKGGVLLRALLDKLKAPAEEDGSMFSCACEILTSLCIASEEVGVRLMDQGLLDAAISAIAGGADYQATWTLVQTLLIFVFDGHASLVPGMDSDSDDGADERLESGDTVEVLSRGSNARQQYSNGIVARDHRDGSYVVDTIDVQNDGEPVSRDRLRRWLTPAESATELPENVLRMRRSFSLGLLPTLLAKCQKQVHRSLLSTLLLFIDRLALVESSGKSNAWVDECGQPVKFAAEHLSHIARIAQSLVGMEPWSAHLQGLRLVGSLLVLLPSSVVQLERHGVLERVQDLFSTAWNPDSDVEGRRGQMSQSDAQKKAVADTASHCLAVAETARADAVDASSAQQKVELQALRDHIQRGDEASVTDLVELCCACDGITLHEFQEAEIAEALLCFLVPDEVGIDSKRMAALSSTMTRKARDSSPGAKRAADRIVDLLQGLLRVGDQLPLLLHGIGGAHGLSTLLKPIRVRFQPFPGSLATKLDDREVAVQPVTSMAEVHKYILENARSTDDAYLEYCEQLVGCRIKQNHEDKPSSYANVMSFHAESGQHTIIYERCGTTVRRVLLPADFSVVRGRTARGAIAAKRQATASREAAAKKRYLSQQQEALGAAKARSEARRNRLVERQQEESVLADAPKRMEKTARVSLDKDHVANVWRVDIRLEECASDAAPVPREEKFSGTAPSLEITSLGAVSVAARWTPLARSTKSVRLQLQLRSRGSRRWSIYEPESQCVVHAAQDEATLTPDTFEVVVLALNPSTQYEACLRLCCVDTDEWSGIGPIATVCTADRIIPDPSAVWEWEREPGEFDTYDQQSTAKLEQIFTSNSRKHIHELVIPGTDTRFQFDLNRMIQTNENSGVSRRVRRISDEVALKSLSLSHHERVCVRSIQGQWIPGVISRVNPGGTFDVECDTGTDRVALQSEEILSLARAARVAKSARVSCRTRTLGRSWSALDLSSARSNRGSSPVSARSHGVDPPEELDLLGCEEDSCDCSCEPIPPQKRLRIRCFFGGFFSNDQDERSGTSALHVDGDNYPHDGELNALGSVFGALGHSSGLLNNGARRAEGTGLWLVKGGHAKYLALLHRMDNTVFGGWLDSRGGHIKKHCSGTLINGELKLSQSEECIFTATVTGNQMSGSWRQRDVSKKRKCRPKADAKKNLGEGMDKGFFAKASGEIHPVHSAHAIERTERDTSWRCDVCGIGNPSPSKTRRYRCVAGCDFDICGTCRDAARKGKGTFQATRESQSTRMGRSQMSLLWEVPLLVYYAIECVDDKEAEQEKHPVRQSETIWCPHVDCMESVQTFPDRAACYRHMTAAHPSPLANPVPALSTTDMVALSACKPCFEPALQLLTMLQAEPSIRKIVTAKAWQSLGLMHQLTRQLEDPLAVATGVLPDWCAVLMRRSRQLFSYDLRKRFFMLTAFGPSRAITWFQAKQIAEAEASTASGQRQAESRTPRGASTGATTIPVLGALKVTLVQISRNRFLDQAAELLSTHAKDRRELRVEFEGEPGTGKGVWPEFFSKASTELRRRWRPLQTSHEFRAERTAALPCLWVDSDEGLTSAGEFVDLELFPRPMLAGSPGDPEATLYWFRFIGRLLAKALLDSRHDCVRIVPLPLHPLFFELLIEQLPASTQQQRWAALGRLAAEDAWPGHALIVGAIAVASEPPDGTSAAPYSQGLPVDAWLECACFEDPVTAMPLKLEGASQTLNLDNIEEFLDLVFDSWLGDGVAKQIEACREGFVEVASGSCENPSLLLGSFAEQAAAYTYSRRPTVKLVAELQVFTAAELQLLLCGKVKIMWSLQELRRTVKPGYAYTDTDKAYVWLLEELITLDQDERSAFLSFVTSSPRLPPGGLGQLPKGAIVVDRIRPNSSNESNESDESNELQRTDSPLDHLVCCVEDTMLPTARTCSQQLRLPSYSSREQLGVMLRVALKHGTEGFGME